MYSFTEAALSAMEAENPAVAKVSLYLANGEELEITEADLMDDGYQYRKQVLSGEKFVPGCVAASSITLILNNIDGRFNDIVFQGAEFVPYDAIRPLGEELIDWRQHTRYTIIDPVANNSEIIELTGYDNIYKLAQAYDGGLKYPITLQKIAEYCCTRCNLILESDIFPMFDFEVPRSVTLTDATYQQMMSYVAAISGCWVDVNRYGLVTFRWFDTEQDPQHSFSSRKIFGKTAQTEDVTITGVRVKAAGTTLDYGETYTVGKEGYIIEVFNNPFITEGTAELIANHLASILVGMSFRPMSLSLIPDLTVEAGDVFDLVDDPSIRGYVTNISWTINGAMSVTCKAESAPKAALKTYSNNLSTQIQQKQILDRELSKRDLRQAQLDGLAANTLGFYTTTETLDDESMIRYMHDSPTLEESKVIYKIGADGFFVSTDGGETYTNGFTSDGTAVLNILSAIGIEAAWIKIDDLIRRINEDGTETIDGAHVTINGQGLNARFESERIETTDAIGDLRDEMSDANDVIYSHLQQQADNMQIKFGEARTYTQEVDGELQEFLNEFFTYIEFTIEGLKIGKSDSPFTAQFSNERLSFLQAGVEVAYFSNNKMYISEAEIAGPLTLSGNGYSSMWFVDNNGLVCLV